MELDRFGSTRDWLLRPTLPRVLLNLKQEAASKVAHLKSDSGIWHEYGLVLVLQNKPNIAFRKRNNYAQHSQQPLSQLDVSQRILP